MINETLIALRRLELIAVSLDADDGTCAPMAQTAFGRWWSAHGPLVADPGVRAEFTRVVAAFAARLEAGHAARSLAERLCEDLASPSLGARSAAGRAILAALGVDCDATPLGDLIAAWYHTPVMTAGEPPHEVARWLALLGRQTVALIGDPELTTEQRSKLVDVAASTVAEEAYPFASTDDLWSSVALSVARFGGDDGASRVARLTWAVEDLELLADPLAPATLPESDSAEW